MEHKPLILFDWDGTLADSMGLCVAEVTLALERMKLPVPEEAVIRLCNGPTYEESMAIVGVPQARREEYFRVRKKAELEVNPRTNRLFPGVREMLETLRPHARLCIASNGIPEYVAQCRDMFGLEGVFDRAEAFIPGRSKAQAIAEILRDYPGCPAIMVGDREGDITAGRANGLPTLCAAFGFGAPEEWALADAVAGSVEELGEMLLRWAETGEYAAR